MSFSRQDRLRAALSAPVDLQHPPISPVSPLTLSGCVSSLVPGKGITLPSRGAAGISDEDGEPTYRRNVAESVTASSAGFGVLQKSFRAEKAITASRRRRIFLATIFFLAACSSTRSATLRNCSRSARSISACIFSVVSFRLDIRHLSRLRRRQDHLLALLPDVQAAREPHLDLGVFFLGDLGSCGPRA